jgi:hypothetical protein
MPSELFSSLSFNSYPAKGETGSCFRDRSDANKRMRQVDFSENSCVHNASDLGSQQLQQIADFAPRTPGWAKGMAYGYSEGHLVLVAHILLRGINGEECKLCASFHRHESIENVGGPDQWPFEAKLSPRNLLEGCTEQPVLVRIVEVAEHPEEGRQFGVRSLVRLRSLDVCLSSSANGGEPVAFDRLREHLGTVCDRELKSFEMGRHGFSAVLDGKSINKTVKSRPQIMDAISGDQGPSVQRRGGPQISNDETVAASVSVTLSGDDIRVTVAPYRNIGLESLEVFFGTAYFQPTASELRSDHAIYGNQ